MKTETPSTCPYCLVDGKALLAGNARLREALKRVEGVLSSRGPLAWFPINVRQEIRAALEVTKLISQHQS